MAGRPKYEPTAEQRMRVQIMVGCGMSQTVICEQTINTQTGLPIDLKTLRKVYRAELDAGTEFANGMVTQALFKKATGTGPQSVTACIFWLKARAGWKDRVHLDHSGNVGVHPGAQPEAAVGDLTDEQLLEEMARHGIPIEPPAA